MAERKEKCPNCGKWFVDLSKHKVCNGRKDSTATKKDDEKDQCPDCGKGFVDLSKHKVCNGRKDATATKKDDEKDQCPNCGQWFVDLSKHKVCNGRKDSTATKKDDEKNQCPNCGKGFVDLSKHKVCNGRKDATATKKDDEKDQCPNCEKWFVDLSKHKVCNGRKDATATKKDDEKDQCPNCEKWFVDLSKHKVCNGRKDATATKKDDEKHQCPNCEKWFVDLSKHKVCNGRKDATATKKDDEKDQCPNCEKWFVDLSKHKVCNGRKDATATKKDDEKDQCPNCEKWFVDLSKHKVCNGSTDSTDRKKVDEKEQCPGIRSLSSHPKMKDAAEEDHACDAMNFRHSSSAPTTHSSKGSNHSSGSQSQSFPYGSGTVGSCLSSRTKINQDTITVLEEFVSSMVANEVIHHSRNPRFDITRFFTDEVQLRKGELETATKHFNKLQQDVVMFLESRTPSWRWKAFRAGSHYDGTKVSRPNEMDCVLFPDLPDHLEPVYSVPGFCKIKVVSSLDDIKNLCDGHFINKVKYRQFIFGIMDKFIEENSSGRTRCKKHLTHPSSPSFGVIYEGVSTDHGSLHIDVDFVPVLHVPCWPPRSVARDLRELPKDISPNIDGAGIMEDGVNLVTTTCPGSPADQDLLWKVACSNAEKKLTFYGENKCWKPVLRTMKRVVEIAKGIEGLTITGKSLEIQKAAQYTKDKYLKRSDFRLSFSTYYIRSLMWSLLYDLTAGNSVWRDETQEAKLHFSLDKLRKMITGELVVPHFFIPGIQDIMTVRAKDREFMYILVRATEIIFSRSRDRHREC